MTPEDITHQERLERVGRDRLTAHIVVLLEEYHRLYGEPYTGKLTSGMPTSYENAKATAYSILCSLDRCEHGRHSVDGCLGCEGLSHGNQLLATGQTLGHTVHGDKIVLPIPGNLHVMSTWIEPRS